MATVTSGESTVQSVQRAAAILRSFAHIDSELGVTTLSKQLGVHKSTVSRLLSTLQHEGFVEQNPDTGKYHLGLGVVTLAGAALERLNWRQVAHPHLVSLAEQTQETVTATILDGGECINVDSVPSPRPIQYVGRIGRRTPLHCTSTGKVLLAYRSAEERAALLSQPLSQLTPKTIVTIQDLETVLGQVRQQGYALADEEFQEGLTAIAAPIFDHAGWVVAAVAVSGPTYRIGSDDIDRLTAAVCQTAGDISAQLGWG